MKRAIIIIFCLNFFSNVHSQGITLLYKGNGGWNDPLSWVQINTPVGQTPIQRVPTELDDVVIDSSQSGLATVRFTSDDTNPDFYIGSSNTTGYRCRSIHISNTYLNFDSPFYVDAAPTLNVYTSNGGFVIIDSNSNVSHGHFYLHGGNSSVIDLQIINSTYGILFSHADWSGILLDPDGKARITGSTLGGSSFESVTTGGELYAENCTFATTNFTCGDNSTDTILNSIIKNDGNNVYLKFFIGRNANFVSTNVNVTSFILLDFTTSGSVLNGNVTTLSAGGNFNFIQEDTSHPLPNIINGDLNIDENELMGISGDIKISGNFNSGTPADEINADTSSVFVNGQDIFEIGGIRNYGNNTFITNCAQYLCHFKLEFFGNTNSNIFWPVGFPVDTLIVNKTGCAKVTATNSLYVSGRANIESGQLALDPNDGIPYKFVCAGDLDISAGGGVFLRKNAAGVTANMAIAGVINNGNSTSDTTCEGLSNPYNGKITFYNLGSLPVTLLDFNGRYQDKTVALNWSTATELNTNYFTVEKSFDQLSFTPLINVSASGNSQTKKDYQYVDNTFLKDINYYRLKMVDIDGKYSYSNIIAIRASNNNSVSVFPNPEKDLLSIRLRDASAETTISIIDAKGAIVKKLKLNPGTAEASINTADLSSGVYSIIFHSRKLNTTLQFIKE